MRACGCQSKTHAGLQLFSCAEDFVLADHHPAQAQGDGQCPCLLLLVAPCKPPGYAHVAATAAATVAAAVAAAADGAGAQARRRAGAVGQPPACRHLRPLRRYTLHGRHHLPRRHPPPARLVAPLTPPPPPPPALQGGDRARLSSPGVLVSSPGEDSPSARACPQTSHAAEAPSTATTSSSGGCCRAAPPPTPAPAPISCGGGGGGDDALGRGWAGRGSCALHTPPLRPSLLGEMCPMMVAGGGGGAHTGWRGASTARALARWRLTAPHCGGWGERGGRPR
eukprot:SAG25_NODE_551_length_6985_cov_321.955998_8_plen_281_part_00